jgi:signal peptidase II
VRDLRDRAHYLLLFVLVVIADQVTKAIVARTSTLHESRLLIEGFLSLTYVRNRGGAFGAFSDADIPYQAVLFSLVSLCALAAIALYAWRTPLENRGTQTALALVMAGAVGNLIDRAWRGSVIDFVDVYWGSHHWPAFNVADSAISIGVAVLVLEVLRDPGTGREAAPSPAGRRD